MQKDLKPLEFSKDKNAIIARLILQKSLLYVELTEKWLDGFLSSKEARIVVKYAIESDKEAFKSVFDEIKGYVDDGTL